MSSVSGLKRKPADSLSSPQALQRMDSWGGTKISSAAGASAWPSFDMLYPFLIARLKKILMQILCGACLCVFALRGKGRAQSTRRHEDTTESRRITGLHRPRGAGQSQNRSSVRPYPPGRFRECKCATPQGIRVYPSIGAAEGREIRLPCYGAPRSFGRRIYAQSRQELRHQSALLPGVAEQAAEPKHSSCFWRRARGQPGRDREFEAGLLRESAPPKCHQPARESRYR